MHIEINSGGLGGLAVAEFQLNMSGFMSDAESVICSFKTVTSKASDLNGGLGNLADAVGEISARIQEEERKLEAAAVVQQKTEDFLELAGRVDKQVATLVNQNKEEFYRVNQWARPAGSGEDAAWYEKAWGWICGAAETIVDAVKAEWEWRKSLYKSLWDAAVEFYNEHKKIIDTVLIVVGAIAAIAAVVVTGGAALIPLLTAIGCSASVAAAISGAVAVIAVVSMAASSTLNVIDIWAEIDNPTFNAWQKGLNIVSGVSNLLYSIGSIYNSLKHVDPMDFLPEKTPAGTVIDTPDPTPTTFNDSVPIGKDPLQGERYYVKGEHYDEFIDFWENGMNDYTYTPAETPQTTMVRAKEIEGVRLNPSEVDNPSVFYKNYSRNDYLDYVSNGGINKNPVEVTLVDNKFYYWEGDGRHRVIAGMELDI